MEVIRGIHNLKAKHRGCVATIGNFDGVHIGHQQVLSHLQQQAKALNLPLLVILFEPQPLEFFSNPERKVPRLTSLTEKLKLLEKLGVDRVLCIKFNKTFSQLPALAFIQSILIEKLAIKYLIIGQDFRFGYKRQGDIDLLTNQSQEHDFALEVLADQLLENTRISSSKIREVLASANFTLAKQLLDRDYSITGRVAYGAQRGRQLGFPTANLLLQRPKACLKGVYVIKALLPNQTTQLGVANIGLRPTVDGVRESLEVHLFDFNGNLYGQRLTITFLTKIRDEIKFNSLAELKQQIGVDVEAAKHYLLERHEQ